MPCLRVFEPKYTDAAPRSGSNTLIILVPPTPALCCIWADKGDYFQKLHEALSYKNISTPNPKNPLPLILIILFFLEEEEN